MVWRVPTLGITPQTIHNIRTKRRQAVQYSRKCTVTEYCLVKWLSSYSWRCRLCKSCYSHTKNKQCSKISEQYCYDIITENQYTVEHRFGYWCLLSTSRAYTSRKCKVLQYSSYCLFKPSSLHESCITYCWWSFTWTTWNHCIIIILL